MPNPNPRAAAAAAQSYDTAVLAELGKLALKVANNPKTRRGFLKSVKELEPERRFPDQEVEDLREEFNSRLEKQELERRTAEINNRLIAQRTALITSGRFTEEQVKEIETKVMPEYGIHDYEAAAILYAAKNPPAPSAAKKSGAVWEMPIYDGLGGDNPINAARKQAERVIDELAARR